MDVDGVLLNFDEAFDSYLKNEVGTNRNNLEPEGLDFYAILFSKSYRITNLLPNKDAVSAVQKLRNYGYSIHVVSALCVETPGLTQGRIHNLYEVFGKEAFETIHFTGFRASKLEYLRKLEPKGMWWLEDNVQNYWDGIATGFRSVLLKDKFNQNKIIRDMQVVDNLTEFAQMVLVEELELA